MNSDQDMKKMVDKFLECGAGVAVITLGEKGFYFATQSDKTPKHVPVEKVNAVDTTVSGVLYIF